MKHMDKYNIQNIRKNNDEEFLWWGEVEKPNF